MLALLGDVFRLKMSNANNRLVIATLVAARVLEQALDPHPRDWVDVADLLSSSCLGLRVKWK